jgi:hypothetical protein
MTIGTFICRREKISFRFHTEKPLPSYDPYRSAKIVNGRLHLSLGSLYLTFALEKQLIPPASMQATKIWDWIMSNEIDVGYNPVGFEAGSFRFEIYLSMNDFTHVRLTMSMIP